MLSAILVMWSSKGLAFSTSPLLNMRDPDIFKLLRSQTPESLRSLDVTAAAAGLAVWKHALLAGRTPDYNGLDGADTEQWPPPPLRDAIVDAVAEVNLPRAAACHPSIVPSALATILDISLRWQVRCGSEGDTDESPSATEPDFSNDSEEYLSDIWDEFEATSLIRDELSGDQNEATEESYEAKLAAELASELVKTWQAPLNKLDSLQGLYGNGEGDLAMLTARPGGFALHDGLWQHDGWKMLEAVQERLREIPELHELIHSLGERPAIDGPLRLGRALSERRNGSPSLVRSSLEPRELNGLERTGELARLSPMDASLLAASRGGSRDELHTSARAMRLELLSRLVEGRLLGYALNGWHQGPAQPSKRRFSRLPRERGGPIVLCLDTSHSMVGGREKLAKAVVCEAVRVAHSHGRACLLFAFSGSHDLATLRLVPPRHRRSTAKHRSSRRRTPSPQLDRHSLERLLSFLAHSFGGGTDVAAPLRRALDLVEPFSAEDGRVVTRSHPDEDIEFAGSDVLLISDGELADPPVDERTFARLQRLRAISAFQVHGLLIGENRPTPLDSLCDKVHTFLCRWDPLQVLARKAAARSSGGSDGAAVDRLAERRALSRRSRVVAMTGAASTQDLAAELSASASSEVAAKLSKLREEWADAADAQRLFDSDQLRRTVQLLEAGLVERSVEARLLMLALVGRVHLLLLGPPGTAKSELCRRLSAIGGFSYFERTLTRYSVPEELFGPLSLKALERDEYRRATEGYAPRAQLVFLDEVFKANSAILNTLLTLLNERVFDEGASRTAVPLRTAVAASNELPDSDELDALYDRFLIRRSVQPVSDDGMLQLLLGSEPIGSAKLGSAQPTDTAAPVAEDALCSALDKVKELSVAVTLPRWVALLLRDARAFIRDGESNSPNTQEVEVSSTTFGRYVSDRRLRQAADLLRSSAAAHGSQRVSIVDCLAVLPHVLWDDPADSEPMQAWIEEHALPESGAEQLSFLVTSLLQRAISMAEKAESRSEIRRSGGTELQKYDLPSSSRLLEEESKSLEKACLEAADEMWRHVDELQAAPNHIFLPAADAVRLRQTLLPVASRRAAELETVARDATVLRSALEKGVTRAVLSELEITGQLRTGEKSDVDGSDALVATSMSRFSDSQLRWSKKEAKARLSTADFKAWKLAQKEKGKADEN